MIIFYTLSHLSVHVVNRQLPENRKSIPKYFKGKQLLKKCNPPILNLVFGKFNNKFPHMTIYHGRSEMRRSLVVIFLCVRRSPSLANHLFFFFFFFFHFSNFCICSTKYGIVTFIFWVHEYFHNHLNIYMYMNEYLLD